MGIGIGQRKATRRARGIRTAKGAGIMAGVRFIVGAGGLARSLRVLTLFLSLPLVPVKAQETTNAPLSDVLKQEVRTILDAGKGQVRKWVEPPMIVVVFRDDSIPERVRETMGIILEDSQNFIGFGEIKLLDLDDIQDSLYGRIDIKPYEKNMRFYWGPENKQDFVEGDIFVFALDVNELLLVGALTEASGSHMRAIAVNRNACFYSAWSKNNVIDLAGIYVQSGEGEASVMACLYEELIQSLGLLNDAEGTTVFTLNDELKKSGNREADKALLDALYSSEIQPGFSVEEVIEVLEISGSLGEQ